MKTPVKRPPVPARRPAPLRRSDIPPARPARRAPGSVLSAIRDHGPVARSTGPRTFEQLESQLGADKVRLSRDVLDRIDEVVPPGVNLSAREAGYTPAVLTDASLRRRSA